MDLSKLKQGAATVFIIEHLRSGICNFQVEYEVLLLKRRSNGIDDGQWALPGGKINKGELPLHAAIRENEEEVGWLDHAHTHGATHMLHVDSNLRDEQPAPVLITYFARVVNALDKKVFHNKEPNTCYELRFFPLHLFTHALFSQAQPNVWPTCVDAIRNAARMLELYPEHGLEQLQVDHDNPIEISTADAEALGMLETDQSNGVPIPLNNDALARAFQTRK